MKKLCAFYLLLFCTFTLQAQDTIQLKNPSFEDHPRSSRTPKEWIDCGFRGESPVDTQPNDDFGATPKAFDGDTYIGMVVRDNDTWESIGQELSSPMEEGQCYSFSLYLARSPVYNSVSRRDPQYSEASYTTPVLLRIWGGHSFCKKEELLAESRLVKNHDWQQYIFRLSPKNDNISHLVFEVYYGGLYSEPYNGNVLVDNASSIEPIDCRLTVDSLRMIEQIREDQQLRDAILKKMTIPESVDAGQFWEWVWEYGPQIKFEKNGALATELYSGEEGEIMNGNIYLHYLALIAQQLPDSQLHIYVHGRDARLVKNRKEAVQQALYDWGFINERVKIFSNIGELQDPPKDLPEDALFFTTETLAFYLRQ